MGALVTQVDTWSGALRVGAGVFQERDNPFDNVQVLIKFELLASQIFHDANYVDLYDLAQHIQKDPNAPGATLAVVVVTIAAQQRFRATYPRHFRALRGTLLGQARRLLLPFEVNHRARSATQILLAKRCSFRR